MSATSPVAHQPHAVTHRLARRITAGVTGGIAGGLVFGVLTAGWSLMGHLIYGIILAVVAVRVLKHADER